jgi:RNA polymerase sigma factor for flagellar operon FliA
MNIFVKQPGRPSGQGTLIKTERGRQKATAQHYPYIEQIARRLVRRLPRYLALDDVIAAGMVGLMESISRFDPKKSDSFSLFADFRIKGAILDTLRASDYLSRDQRLCLERMKKVRQRLLQKHGREPEPEEVAEALGCDLARYHEMVARMSELRSVRLDERISSAEALLPQESSRIADGARAEELTFLIDAVRRLPERLRAVIVLHYFQDRSLKEIGQDMGFTESRACQLHVQAVDLLRKALIEGDEYPLPP